MRKRKGHTYEGTLNIYSDGSMLSHPRRGGAGAVFVTIGADGRDRVRELPFGGRLGATSNEMELVAATFALREAVTSSELDEADRVVVFSDSQYLVDNVRSAKVFWPKAGWCKRDGSPVENVAEWKALNKAAEHLWSKRRVRVDFEWVKGHRENPYNKMADRLAKQSAKATAHPASERRRVRRKQTSRRTDRGSVEMKGQRLRIRIIEDDYMPEQRLGQYRYEVVSPRSQYVGNVDWIYSEEDLEGNLWAGHVYDVLVNRDTQNPRVVRILREVSEQ